MRTWQMEPLPPATIAGLTPPEVDIRFHDDRIEPIPYDAPTDLVAISVETYTAKRAYQIASEYRRRHVPVVMGGFHATLCPDEVGRFAESLVVGEAEAIWPQVLEDYRVGRPKKLYVARSRPILAGLKPDRSIYADRKYLPIRLVEGGRGCRFRCDFCAVQSMFGSTRNARPIEDVVVEVRQVRRTGQLVFFIDDNITADLEAAKALLQALVPLKIRWVSQSTIHAAFDEEYLHLLKRSGCQGLLVGFETFEPRNLQRMSKSFNLGQGGPAKAMENFRRHGIRIYGTFVFGYDHDTRDSFDQAVRFATEQGMFIAAFNHITPFPGTPLYARLAAEGRLRYGAWWLDEGYRYNQVPFRPVNMTALDVERCCLEARRRFYSWGSMLRRGMHSVNRSDLLMLGYFAGINLLHRWDVGNRNGFPLGDEGWTGELIEAR